VQSPISSTIANKGSSWKNGQFNSLVARISNTSSLAFGQIYTILSSTESSIVVSATSTPTDPNPAVTGTTCSGSGLCAITPSLSALTVVDPTGRYVHNIIDDKYYLIASATVGSPGKFMIANNEPDDFTTMTSDKSIEITDGIRPGDSFQILSYAAVTARSGLVCGSRTDLATTAYIRSQAGSKNLIRYADICDLGRDVSGKFGLEFDGLNGAISDRGTVTVEYSRIQNNLRGIFLADSRSMSGTLGIRYNFIQNSRDGGIVGDTASNNDLSYNRVSLSGGGGGIYLYNESNDNSLTGNVSHQNALTGISIENSNDNRVDSNIVFRNQSGAGGLFLNNSSNNQVTNLTSFANGTPSTKMVGFGMLSFGGSNNLIASSALFTNVRSGIVVADSPGNGVINNRSFANGYHGMTQVCEARDYSVTLFGNQFYSNHFNGLMLENSGNCSAYVINDRYGTLGSNGVVDLYMGAAGASHPGIHRLYLFNTILASPTPTNLSEMAASIDQSYYIISRKHNGVAGSTQIWGHYVTPTADLYNYANNLWEKSATAHIFTTAGRTSFSRWLGRFIFTSENRPTFLRWLDRLGNASVTESRTASLHYTVGSADLSGGPYYYRLTATTSTCPTDCQFAVWRNGTLVGTATVGQAYTDSNGFGFTIDNGANPYEAGDTYTFTAWDASNDSRIAKSVVMHPR
jgi:parallel beta-helix repeat protein